MRTREDERYESQVRVLLYELIESKLHWPFQDTTIEFQETGLTNNNYIVTHNGIRVAIRISGNRTQDLGINRYAEQAALQALKDSSIAPELIYFDPQSGHMITRHIEGSPLEQTELAQRAEEVAALFRRYHSLSTTDFHFYPYQDIRDRIQTARNRQLPLPDLLEPMLDKLSSIETIRDQAGERFRGLCHNDPFPNNFLDDGCLRLLDWEYAGMGDIMFDLACVAWGCQSKDRDRLLAYYFGEEEGLRQRETLENMIYVVHFWNAMWATLQIGAPHPTYHYEEISRHMFAGLEQQL